MATIPALDDAATPEDGVDPHGTGLERLEARGPEGAPVEEALEAVAALVFAGAELAPCEMIGHADTNGLPFRLGVRHGRLFHEVHGLRAPWEGVS